MNKKKKNLLSRRKFMGTGLLGAAGIGVLPQSGFGKAPQIRKPAAGTLRLGFIGLGRQANGLLNSFISMPDIEVIAGCDVYGAKRQRFLNRTAAYYQEHNQQVDVKVYENYHDLLARKDVDAVVIATPDHWHALIAIDACKAGKDIYLEKPLTFTIKEGQELVEAVRSNNTVLATGSMQRSYANFQHAVTMVQKGRIGPVSKVFACVGGPPKPFDLPEENVPADLNWDLWLGPLDAPIHFNNELNPPISLNPPENEKMWGGWRWYKETGGGLTTDWGAHMFDIAQWAIGMDRKGPLEIIPAGYQDTQYLTFKYANGVTVTEQPFDEKETRGCKFFGRDGWVEVSRSHYEASDPSLYPVLEEGESLQGGGGRAHHIDFIESVRRRKDPIAPVEIGHSTCVTCTLGNIAYDLGRPLNWDPEKEQFVNDPEAEKHLHRPYRAGYRL
ncbi:Gfo/Idh/MocA family protein [Cyclobacterium jeungdonense]|uniref:Gfo/Idh/MocA family oxidoreductase n=1 Tax=Cyclobacterium jeungdonense TaxID=708087 RepID=A0ABT8CFZ5_9BACT|nr:Gfo/Idh/MocA family oxidoreductase [Cyclobacterium jeungdonense]MDN3690600.1 Gfo/Idh/MocA family oxidoreductase [Cyclobacterium jeungdonense]